MNQFVAYLIIIILCLPGPGSIIIISGQGQKTSTKVLERGDDWQCPPMEERKRARNEIHQIANSAILATICNGTLGWRRVAFINMTDTSYNCPTGLSLTSYSKRTCGRSHANSFGCSSTTFSVGGLPYSRVCGRISGYQFGWTNAFRPYTRGIDSYYVGGISLTHGGAGSRQHIWTFAAGATEVDTGLLPYRCPCDIHNYSGIPAFIGNDYFCESGFNTTWRREYVLFPDDVLWDASKPWQHVLSS